MGGHTAAGDQFTAFASALPRVLVPGDVLPFIGVLRDRHSDFRRVGAATWRGRRRETHSRLTGCTLTPTATSAPAAKMDDVTPGPPDQEIQLEPVQNRFTTRQNTAAAAVAACGTSRDKSPKSVLREAKENLRTKDTLRCNPPVVREKSPTAVLREAKLRLRKLEIEAEAVEKSYQDFRKRQSELKEGRRAHTPAEKDFIVMDLENNISFLRSRSLQKLENTLRADTSTYYKNTEKMYKDDFDKYLRDYSAKFDIVGTHFRNKNATTEQIKPIPKDYCIEDDKKSPDYLETPLTEFRKLYHSEKSTYKITESNINVERPKTPETQLHPEHARNTNEATEGRHDRLKKNKPNKKAELEMLKQNINKMYNLPIESKIDDPEIKKDEENLLRVEVESVNQGSDIEILKSQNQDLLVVVQSAVETSDLANTKSEAEAIPTQMTIIISPRINQSVRDDVSERSRRSVSPEQAAKLTRNDVLDAIFHADPNDRISSVQMDLDPSKDILEDSEYEKGEYEKEDYADDFSADVDNYNSRSDYGNNSPISLPKTSEDENFWDS